MANYNGGVSHVDLGHNCDYLGITGGSQDFGQANSRNPYESTPDARGEPSRRSSSKSLRKYAETKLLPVHILRKRVHDGAGH